MIGNNTFSFVSFAWHRCLCVSDHPRHPADGPGGSVDPGGHTGSDCVVPRRPHQMLTICRRHSQGKIHWWPCGPDKEEKKKHCILLYLFSLMQWLASQLVAWFNELRFLPTGIGCFFSFQVMGRDISYSLSQLDICSSLYSDLWLIIIGVQKVNNACCTSSLSHKSIYLSITHAPS